MNIYNIVNGLFLNLKTVPPTACGYVFSALGKGAFEPTSRILIACEVYMDKTREATEEEIVKHNSLLGEMELQAMIKHGRGVLYLSRDVSFNATYYPHYVATWSGAGKTQCSLVRKSWHNMAGKDGRTDVYFTLAGKRWHGVNIGDSQICRCHILKKQK